MNVSVTSAVLASVVSLSVAIGILLKRPYRRLYTRFAMFSSSLFLWHLGSFITQLTGGTLSPFQAVAGLIVPPATFLFFSELLKDQSGRMQRWLQLSIAISIGMLVLTISPARHLLVVRASIAVYIVGGLGAVLRFMYQSANNALHEKERKRLRYLYIAGAITLTLATGEAIPNMSIPSALGHIATTLYIYFLYQSIVAKRLINLVELLGKGAVVGVLTLVLATIYALLVVWVRIDQDGLWLFNTLVASFVILILYDQIRTWVEHITTKLIFRQPYNIPSVTNGINHTLRTTLSIEQMCERTLDALYEAGIASHIALYLANEDESTYALLSQRGYTDVRPRELQHYPPLVHILRRDKRPLLIEDLTYRYEELPALLAKDDTSDERELDRTKEAITALNELSASVLLPLVSYDRIQGVLTLGNVPPHPGYSTDDIRALRSVSEACAVVIENSQEYEKRRERDRLAAIGEMATGMAHEIRNPLGAIKGAAQCLEPDQLPAHTDEFIQVIIEEVDRLNGVVCQFLDYARPYHGHPCPTQINEVVDNTLRLIAHEDDATTVDITTDLAHDLPLVLVDSEQLKQVLINLTRNAIEAMNNHGSLTIHTTTTHDNPEASPIHPAKAIEFAHVLIKLTDTGQGIDPNDLPRLFVPFYTTKERGTGLGLAISQRIVESFRGRIDVSSTLGRGTTFTVRLPAMAKDSQIPTSQPVTST